jgi:hypothetical protein
MNTCCSKHVEAWNKYIKKECVKLVINQKKLLKALPWKQRKSSPVLLSFMCRCQQCETQLSLSIKCPTFLSSLNQIWLLWTVIRKSRQYQISCKSVQWKPHWYMRTDGRADVKKLIGAFRYLQGAPKKKVLSNVTCSVYAS